MREAAAIAIFVVGSAGSGKSTVARALAAELSAAYLDKDRMSPLVATALAAAGHDRDEREGNAFYRETVMPLEYATLLGEATDNLALGTSVVVDAPFAGWLGDPDYLERVRAEFGWSDTRSAFVVQVRASEDINRARLVERGLQRDHAKLARWDEFWSELGAASCSWRGAEIITVDNDATVDIIELAGRLSH